MPKKIPIKDKRGWLQKYEGGQSEASIAKKAKRNIKTVKTGIEWARNERYAATAQSDLVKEALRNHQEQLLRVIDNIISALVMPSLDLSTHRGADKDAKQIISSGAVVGYEKDKGLVVTLRDEGTPQWGLLREHLKGDPLWAAISDWKQAMVKYVQAGRMLALKAEDLLQRKTGYRVVQRPIGPPFLYYNNTSDLICQIVIKQEVVKQKAIKQKLNNQDEEDLEERITVDKNRGTVMCGVGSIMAECPGSEDKCRDNILEAFKALRKLNDIENVIKKYQGIEQPMMKAKQIAEEISLLGLIPGKCRVCERFGI